jgi:hypothetical protein
MIVRLIRALSAALIVPVGASLFIAGYFSYKKFGYGAVVLAALGCAGVVMFAARGAFKLAFFRPDDPAPAWQAAAQVLMAAAAIAGIFIVADSVAYFIVSRWLG